MGTRRGTSPAGKVLRLASVYATEAVEGSAVHFDPVGGMQHHTSQLTAALDRLGVAQTVVTAFRPGAPRCEAVGSRSAVHRVGLPVRRMRQLWALPAARFIAGTAGRFDVVHAHLGEDLAVLPLGVAAARANAAPLVVTVHCSLRHTLAGAGARVALLGTIGSAIEHWAERQATAVITLTTTMAGMLATDGVAQDRITVVPSGAQPCRFSPGRPDPRPDVRRPRLVFAGRLSPQKGADILLEALPLLRHRVPLVVVGDGPQRQTLEDRARRLGIADRVTFTGFVPHVDVPGYLSHSDVLVLPSRYEELGSILVEALHAGVPVVAAAVGGIPEVVLDGVTGLLVPPSDPAALATAIDALLDDPTLRRRMSEAARVRARAYDWDDLAVRIAEVYAAAVPDTGSASRWNAPT